MLGAFMWWIGGGYKRIKAVMGWGLERLGVLFPCPANYKPPISQWVHSGASLLEACLLGRQKLIPLRLMEKITINYSTLTL